MDKFLFNTFLEANIKEFKKNITTNVSVDFPLLDIESLLDQLKAKILKISISALIKDIHSWKVNYLNSNLNTKELYKKYDNNFSNNTFMFNFFNKYPLLSKKISITKNNFEFSINKVLFRLKKDLIDIQSCIDADFKIQDLIYLHFDQGDTHNNGQNVAILEFKNKKLVYKPHTLENEIFLNSLLSNINQLGEFDFKVIKNISKDNHGWQEFVLENYPKKDEHKKVYYKNLGSLTALCYFLTLTDIHYDNIIIDGKNPVFYDIETLFSADGTTLKHPNMVNNVLNTSVLPVNPSTVFENVDISGMFGNFNYKEQNFQTKTIVYPFTSDIRIEEEKNKIYKKSDYDKDLNLMNPALYTDSFLIGFKKLAYLLLDNKNWLENYVKTNITKKNINRINDNKNVNQHLFGYKHCCYSFSKEVLKLNRTS